MDWEFTGNQISPQKLLAHAKKQFQPPGRNLNLITSHEQNTQAFRLPLRLQDAQLTLPGTVEPTPRVLPPCDNGRQDRSHLLVQERRTLRQWTPPSTEVVLSLEDTVPLLIGMVNAVFFLSR